MGYEATIRKQAGLLSLSIYAVLQRQTACIQTAKQAVRELKTAYIANH